MMSAENRRMRVGTEVLSVIEKKAKILERLGVSG